ncbi:hypothetical protein QC764_208130 [Podospora pseudoanserina]|uniref:Kelch repeat protein n=1 Tax=Podospora pseudoanserina TaxID=2609844 RepID=A0ABR0II85_9PEZI|nr:hypothetical protein QC764_208130 [Podospora pseudoanserina]
MTAISSSCRSGLVRAALLGLGIFQLHGLVEGQEISDSPPPDKFVRRGFARVALIGDYLYIEGGEVSQQVGGQNQQGSRSNYMNSTLSIDMSKSWDAKTVPIRIIDNKISGKPPARSRPAFWTNQQDGSFYVWGGMVSYRRDRVMPKFPELYKFVTDGSGGGKWSIETPSNPDFLRTVYLTELAASAATDETAFIFGGLAGEWTDLTVGWGRTEIATGALAFNMKTKTFEKLGYEETLVGAVAEHIPQFNLGTKKQGVILIMGGYIPEKRVDGNSAIDYSSVSSHLFDNITIFDPETRQMHYQTTTGPTPPGPRREFCLAGFATKEGGYDILLFGGESKREPELDFRYEDAWILSLPGFVWTKAPNMPTQRRADHHCTPAGKRQVISVGGTAPGWREPDPAPQGLMVFDMPSMTWRFNYDADAGDYESPQVIKDWYKNGSLSKVKWSTPILQQVFAPGSFGIPNPDSPDSNSQSSGQGHAIGAIVGGVLGGLAGLLALIAVGIWYFFYRPLKQKQKLPQTGSQEALAAGDKYLYTRTPVNIPLQEAEAGWKPAEVASNHGYAELSVFSPGFGPSPSVSPGPPQYSFRPAGPQSPMEMDGYSERR